MTNASVTDAPDKLDLGSQDIAEERRQELLRLFPEIRTEAGKLDFERLKLALGESIDTGKERYGLTWAGKADCCKTKLEQQLELHVTTSARACSGGSPLRDPLEERLPPHAPVEALTLEGKTVYSVAGGDLLVCLERALTLELIRAMAARKPARAVCLDVGFAGDDTLKTNAVQTFKTKGVASFKTV